MLFKRVELYRGYGSKRNRVHIFDQTTGRFLSPGFIKNEILFARKPVINFMVRLYEPRSHRNPSSD